MIWLLICLSLFWLLLLPYPELLFISVLFVGVLMVGVALADRNRNGSV